MNKAKARALLSIVLMILLLLVPMTAQAAPKVKINKTKTTIYVGNTTTLKISGTSKKVTWSSSNKKVATVSSKGKVTAKKVGTATITAKVSGKKYKCKVTVKNPYINATKKTLYDGQTYNLKLTGTTIKSASTSNKTVATVSKTGKVTAKKAGKAIITLKGKNGKSYKCTVTVKATYINAAKKSLYVGQTYTLKLTGTSIKSVSSSKTSVATVSKGGKVTAKAAGTATITLTGTNGKKYKCSVTVKNPYINKTSLQLTMGQNYTLKLTGTTISSVASSNTKVATVSKTGLVTAIKEGTATITLKGKNGKNYNCNVTVLHVHDYKWVVTKEPSATLAESEADFGTREKRCDCGDVKIEEVMVNIGDRVICGVFDQEETDAIVQYTNRARRHSYTSESDPFGNHLGFTCPAQLKVMEELNSIAKIRAAETTIEFSHDKMRTKGENLATGYANAYETYRAWMESTPHRRAMIDDTYTETGVAFFWYDGDDSGENLYPLAVQVFEGDGLPPIEPDEESKIAITNDENGIPDKAFYQYALEKLDRNGNGVLSRGEAARPAILFCSDLGIKDITGIQYFTGAVELDFANNEIKDLSPLTLLEDEFIELDFSGNGISDLSPLKKVRTSDLILDNNNITDISPLRRTNGDFWVTLSLNSNHVTDLSPLSGMTVQYLYLSDNNLTDISQLGDLVLDNMFDLDLSNNNISDISVLDGLGVDRNPFRMIDHIDLSYNNLSKLDATIRATYITVAHNNLTSLCNSKTGESAIRAAEMDVSYNRISDLTPIKKLGHIGLVATNNCISDISPLAGMTLTKLILTNNQIVDITPLKDVVVEEVRSDTDRREIDLTHNKITDLAPLKDSVFMESLLDYINWREWLFLQAYTSRDGDDMIQNHFRIAEGNNIAVENAKANLPEELLNADVYYNTTYYAIANEDYIITHLKWIDIERFVGAPEYDVNKNGLVKEDGILRYYENGKINCSYYGIAPYEGKDYLVFAGWVNTEVNAIFFEYDNGVCHTFSKERPILYDTDVKNMYCITNGAVDTSVTGTVKVDGYDYVMDGTYCYMAEGVWDSEYEGVGICEQYNGWETRIIPRYFKDGWVDTSFHGIGFYEDMCWLLSCGVFSEDITGLVAGEDGIYRYYNDSKWDTEYVGLSTIYDEKALYFVRDGYIDEDYTGGFVHNDIAYYIENGKQSTDYCGVVDVPGSGTYLIYEGVQNRGYGGIYLDGDEPLYFSGGKLDESIEGVQYYHIGGQKCWVMKNGRRDTSFNGLAYVLNNQLDPNSFGQLVYFSEGKRDGSYVGFVHATIDGIEDDWFVNYGSVDRSTQVYIKEGSEYHGMCLKDGRRAEDMEGIVTQYDDESCVELWYVKDGWVQFDYTGGYLQGSYYYRITNGKVTSYSRA